MALSTDILVSLHGRRLGITSEGNLVLDGAIIAVNGNSPAQLTSFYTDFLGDTLPPEVNFQEGSDTAATFALTIGNGGLATLTTAASATVTMAVDGAQVDLGSLNWYAANGGLAMEIRAKADDITTIVWFMGFTDQTAALEMPWTLTTTTYTSNATDSFGFLFDTAATLDTIRCVGVDGGTDATNVDTSDAWAAGTFKTFRCEADTDGTATYFIDGELVATIENAVDPTVGLVPYFGGFPHAASARALIVDYVHVTQNRA